MKDRDIGHHLAKDLRRSKSLLFFNRIFIEDKIVVLSFNDITRGDRKRYSELHILIVGIYQFLKKKLNSDPSNKIIWEAIKTSGDFFWLLRNGKEKPVVISVKDDIIYWKNSYSRILRTKRKTINNFLALIRKKVDNTP